MPQGNDFNETYYIRARKVLKDDMVVPVIADVLLAGAYYLTPNGQMGTTAQRRAFTEPTVRGNTHDEVAATESEFRDALIWCLSLGTSTAVNTLNLFTSG